MADVEFYTILTNIGMAQIANANVFGNKINITKFKAGDGGGNYYNPTEDQTDLKRIVWEGPVNSLTVDDDNPNWILADAVIPSEQGGFTIREVGVYDDDDNLIAVGKYPESYKPVLTQGASKDLFLKIIFEVGNAANVTLKVDPSVSLATKGDLNTLENKLNDKMDKHIKNKQVHFIDAGNSIGDTDNLYELVTTQIDADLTNKDKGLTIRFYPHKDSTGAISVKVFNKTYDVLNAKKKPLTKVFAGVPTLITFDSTNFFQASGGSNDSVNFASGDLLTGKFANNEDGESVPGTMPERGTVTQALGINGVLNLPEGHYDSIKVTQNIPFLNPNWNDIWETKEYTVGAHMYNNGANYALLKVPNGHYINGCNWVGAYTPDLRPENIVAGKNVLGVGGSATIESLGGLRVVKNSFDLDTRNTEYSDFSHYYHVSLGFRPQSVAIYTNGYGSGYYFLNTPMLSGKIAMGYGGNTEDKNLSGIATSMYVKITNDGFDFHPRFSYPTQTYYYTAVSSYISMV